MAATVQLSFVVCLIAAMASNGDAQTGASTDAPTTTAAASAATTAAPGGSTAAPGGSTAAPGGSTAAPGTGPAASASPAGSTAAQGTGAPGTATTQSPEIACLSCNGTGDSNDPCMTATSSFSTTINCDREEGCWVYREEDAGNVTISRGCGRSDLSDRECTSQKESEQCDNANNVNIRVCRRCCRTASCNHASLTLTGSVGTPTAYVSTVVIVTSFITAVFCNDLRF